jgi:hypothetical protein
MIPRLKVKNLLILKTETAQQLSEDFLIRGQAWSQLYYLKGFLKKFSMMRSRILNPSIIIPRTRRCLWLGVLIATVSPQSGDIKCFSTNTVKVEKWITCNYEFKKSPAAQFALEPKNTRTILFNRSSKTLSPGLRQDEDIKMDEH